MMRPERYNRGGMVNWRMREGIHTCACSIPALLATHVRTGGECMQVQWGSEHSSKITQHHTVKVYSDWELQSTVGVQTVLSAKWAATPGALLVIIVLSCTVISGTHVVSVTTGEVANCTRSSRLSCLTLPCRCYKA